jgi:hypothetical protein
VRLPRASRRDYIVWSLITQGYEPEQIGGTLRLSDDEVKSALMRVHAEKAKVGHEMVDIVINRELMASVKDGTLRDALKGAMTATRILVTSAGVAVDAQGNPLTEPDHAMRIEGAKTLGKLIRDIRPTSPAVVANIQNNNSNTQNVIAGGRSFEARRRAAAERRGVVDGGVAAAEQVEESDNTLDGEEVEDVELDDPDAVDEEESEDEDE